MGVRKLKKAVKTGLPQPVFKLLRTTLNGYRRLRNKTIRTWRQIVPQRGKERLSLNCTKKHADWFGPKQGYFLDYDKISRDAGVSLIVLNRDGAELLPRFFDSLKYISVPMEIVLVDHASSDNSLEIVEKYKNSYDINVIAKDCNDTFSQSNNDGARQAQYEYLVFINNDVFITDETRISDGITLLENEDAIGLVGWNLVYSLSAYGEKENTQHIGISFYEDKNFSFYRPYNIQENYFASSGYTAVCVPAVTAALAMCRKNEFLELGGFCEDYVYGYEDVDLCMAFNRVLNKQSVVLPHNTTIHAESISQNVDSPLKVRARRKGNIDVLKDRFGGAINRCISSQAFSNHSLWKSKNLTIGFVVTESQEGTVVGDYFTAKELGRQLKHKLKCEIRFLPLRGEGSEHMYDVSCIDALFVMIDRYDIRRTYNRSARLTTVAWMRNWFDRWAEREWFLEFDQYFCSSEHACSHMHDKYHIDSKLLRLATNEEIFNCTAEGLIRDIDISFVGSYWDAPRDIEKFNPEGLDFHLYGYGWDDHASFTPFLKGPVVYEDVPKIYSCSKIVIDDANDATKEYGSVNSRVFDAIISGALVVTNGLIGAKEVFGDLLPTYDNERELRGLLEYYLSHDDIRTEKVEQLKRIVLRSHTYRHRAGHAANEIKDFVSNKYRISIKVPAPTMAVAHQWGDYHFALSLRKEFKKRGHSVRIDVLEHWYDQPEIEDDVVIVLRGLSSYKPCKSHINIMWNISHPDKIEVSEYDLYDHVFVSSEGHAEQLNQSCRSPVAALLQCTDADLFVPGKGDLPDTPNHKLLFVGNSRRQYRKIVKDSIEADLPITIYGGLWKDFVSASYIAEEHIENHELSAYYEKADVVLNDHWEAMASNGFISNRLFDAVASGATVLSDYVDGIEALFGDAVLCYDGSVEDLKKQYALALDRDRSDMTVSNRIRLEHSFSARADQMLKMIDNNIAKNRISAYGAAS